MKAPRPEYHIPSGTLSNAPRPPRDNSSEVTKRRGTRTLTQKTTLVNYQEKAQQTMQENVKKLAQLYERRKAQGRASAVIDLEVLETLRQSVKDRTQVKDLLEQYTEFNGMQEAEQAFFGIMPQDETLQREYTQLQEQLVETRRRFSRELAIEESRLKRALFTKYIHGSQTTSIQDIETHFQTLPSHGPPLQTELQRRTFSPIQAISQDVIDEILEGNIQIMQLLKEISERFETRQRLREAGDIRERQFHLIDQGPAVQIGTSFQDDPIYSTSFGTYMVNEYGYAYVYDPVRQTFIFPNTKGYGILRREDGTFFTTKKDHPELFDELGPDVETIEYDKETGLPYYIDQGPEGSLMRQSAQATGNQLRRNLPVEKYGEFKPMFVN